MMIKKLMLVAGCLAMLTGCTKSNIVQPEAQQGPDFNVYSDIEIDVEQVYYDLEESYLNEEDYPMGVFIEFELKPEEECVDLLIVVKNDTSAEDTAYYVDEVIKGLNDQIAVQDFSYEESSETSFGGLFKKNVINLTVCDEYTYFNGGEAIVKTQIPKDTYMKLEIQ